MFGINQGKKIPKKVMDNIRAEAFNMAEWRFRRKYTIFERVEHGADLKDIYESEIKKSLKAYKALNNG